MIIYHYFKLFGNFECEDIDISLREDQVINAVFIHDWFWIEISFMFSSKT